MKGPLPKYGIFVLAFLMVVIMAFCFEWPLEYDAAQYERLGWNLSQGNGFSDSFSPPYVPTATREPVYPLFIGALYRIFGRRHEAVFIAQAFLVAISAFLTYKLAGRYFPLGTACLAGVLVAADPTVSGFGGQFWTESLTLFLLLSFFYLMVALMEKSGFLFALIGGALLGALALCRAVFMFLPIVVLAILIFSNRRALGKKMLQGVLLIAAFAVVVAPWMYRNKKEFDAAFITTRSGHLLLWRAMRTEYTPREVLMHVVYGTSDTLGRKLFPDDYSRMTVRGWWGHDNVYTLGAKMYDDYLAKGYSELAADRMVRSEAVELIKKHPVQYALQSFVELWKLSFFEIVPFAYSDRFGEFMKGSDIFFVIGKVLRVGLRYFYSWLVLGLAAAGFLKSRGFLGRGKLMLLLPIVYIVLTAIPFNCTPRYLYPALPFIMIFAAAALTVVFNDVRQETKEDYLGTHDYQD